MLYCIVLKYVFLSVRLCVCLSVSFSRLICVFYLHYFPPVSWLPPRPHSITALWPNYTAQYVDGGTCGWASEQSRYIKMERSRVEPCDVSVASTTPSRYTIMPHGVDYEVADWRKRLESLRLIGKVEGTHRVRTHAILLLTVTLTLTFDVYQPQNHIICRISQDHSLHQVWTLWDLSFFS